MRDLVMSKMIIKREEDEFEVDIEAYVNYTEDFDYGSDADGNRGSYRVSIDEVEEVTASDVDCDEVSLTKEEEDQAKSILTRKFLED